MSLHIYITFLHYSEPYTKTNLDACFEPLLSIKKGKKKTNLDASTF